MHHLLPAMEGNNPCSTLVDTQQSRLDASESYPFDANEFERTFITQIHATGIMSSLHLYPPGFYVSVEIDGKTTESSIKTPSTRKDMVEWDEGILLPSEQSSIVSFNIYASFELGPRLGKGELLGKIRLTVGELLDHTERLRPASFLIQREGDESMTSCCSLGISTERRTCDVNEYTINHDQTGSDTTSELAQLTDMGHHFLLNHAKNQNQKDLDEAVACFERAHEMCPLDDPHRSTVLYNLANARLVECEANDQVDLDVPITLLRSSFHLRDTTHPDHCATALELSSALLDRFEGRHDENDIKEAKSLFSGTVNSFPDKCGARTVSMILRLAEVAVPKTTFGISQTGGGDPEDEELLQKAQCGLANLPDGDPSRAALLERFARLLKNWFTDSGNLSDIHESVSMSEMAVTLTPVGHREKPARLDLLGCSLRDRFYCLGDISDLNKSILMHEEAIDLVPNGHPNKPALLGNLGQALSCRFDHLGNIADINKSISMHQEAVRFTPNDHPNKPVGLSSLARSLSRRFNYLGDIADVNESISMHEEAIRLTPTYHPNKPIWLDELGISLFSRFHRYGDMVDIDKSISMHEEAIRLIQSGHPCYPEQLGNLANSLSARFDYLGDIQDISKSVSIHEEANRLTPSGHPRKPARLGNLANALSRRFKRFGDIADINKCISMHQEAVRLTPNDHPNKPIGLSNVANSLSIRFDIIGDRADIDDSVSMHEEAVRLTPNNHSSMPTWLDELGCSLLSRFHHYGNIVDIDKSISIHEEAIRLTPSGHPSEPARLSNLANSLSRRFVHLGDKVDINKSISLLEEANRLTPSGNPRKPVRLGELANSLSHRFDHLGDIADINKSVLMYQEAVRLTPNDHPTKPIRLSQLAHLLSRRFDCLRDESDIDRMISLHEEANRLTPSSDPNKSARLGNLANSLACRFYYKLGNIADLDKSVSVLEEAVHLAPNGHPYRLHGLGQLASSLACRFDNLGNITDMNRAISVHEEEVLLIPIGHPSKPARLGNFANLLSRRFDRVGNITDLDKSISLHEEAASLSPADHPSRPTRLGDLAISLSRRYDQRGDTADINKSISMHEEVIRLVSNDNPYKPTALSALAHSLSLRFYRLGDIADIKKSISIYQESVRLTPNGHVGKPLWLTRLAKALMSYYKHSNDPSSLITATLHSSEAAKSPAGPASHRFDAACTWMSCVQIARNSQALIEPFTTIITVLPQLAWPAAERYQKLLDAACIVSDATAAAIDVGQPTMAVEWLEHGRSAFWNPLLHLRTPVDDLRVDHPIHAEQFRLISHGLEDIGSRLTALNIKYLTSARDSGSPESLEQETQRHHELVLIRDKLLEEIRTLPGFERFLLPKTIEQLFTIARSGPVVYLNASKKRCDALIVKAELRDVTLVPLPDVVHQDLEFLLRLFLEGVQNSVISVEDISALVSSSEEPLSQRLLGIVKDRVTSQSDKRPGEPIGNEEPGPDDLWQRILEYLWVSVVSPVLEALDLSTSPSGVDRKMTRIFWCPTGPFSFLPIHAAGLYDAASSDPGHKLSDFAISSYIPMLSALAPLTEKGLNEPSSDARPDGADQLRNNDGQMKHHSNEEVDHIKQLSDSLLSVTLDGSNGTIEHVMERMRTSGCIHFACHGVQDREDSPDRGYCLGDERHFKLSDSIRLSRPQGGLVFLSACQTAKGDEKLAEESVHLATAMLLAGYSGIIVTILSMKDRDAQQVTKDVYKHLVRGGKVPDPLEAAEALHFAVQRLRNDGASFSSWVPFIYVGR